MSNIIVDYKTDLCLRMMVYAAFDDKFSDMKVSEVQRRMGPFFPDETIQAAAILFLDGWIPPKVDLSFYRPKDAEAIPKQCEKCNGTGSDPSHHGLVTQQE